MRRILWLSVLFFAFSLPGVTWGQKMMESGPRVHGEFKPVVGGWAEYQIVAKGGTMQKMKIAVVGKEGDAYWYETVTEGKGVKIVYKILVSGDPNDDKGVKRMILKQGSDPAMELPVQTAGRESKGGKKAVKMVDKGTETVKVPAGTFQARHLRYEEKEAVDVWVDEKVAPYGLVKSKSRDTEMILTGYGTGARSLITEKPQKLDLPKMPRR